jgi:hypothetical protein
MTACRRTERSGQGVVDGFVAPELEVGVGGRDCGGVFDGSARSELRERAADPEARPRQRTGRRDGASGCSNCNVGDAGPRNPDCGTLGEEGPAAVGWVRRVRGFWVWVRGVDAVEAWASGPSYWNPLDQVL